MLLPVTSIDARSVRPGALPASTTNPLAISAGGVQERVTVLPATLGTSNCGGAGGLAMPANRHIPEPDEEITGGPDSPSNALTTTGPQESAGKRTSQRDRTTNRRLCRSKCRSANPSSGDNPRVAPVSVSTN